MEVPLDTVVLFAVVSGPKVPTRRVELFLLVKQVIGYSLKVACVVERNFFSEQLSVLVLAKLKSLLFAEWRTLLSSITCEHLAWGVRAHRF